VLPSHLVEFAKDLGSGLLVASVQRTLGSPTIGPKILDFNKTHPDFSTEIYIHLHNLVIIEDVIDTITTHDHKVVIWHDVEDL
jgi:hypothetical protein